MMEVIMNNLLDILALSGSLRTDSFNAKLLAAARDLAPADAGVEIYDYRDVPLYDGDIEVRDYPEAARRLKDRIRKADALLIATPEYNYSVPGVLKNALDWVSRPYGDSALTGKPLAIIGGGGGQGTNRAQDHLRQIAHGLDMQVVRRPEIFIANVWGKFDENGALTDPIANKLIAELLGNLAGLVRDADVGRDIRAAA
jgi:chromate reductase